MFNAPSSRILMLTVVAAGLGSLSVPAMANSEKTESTQMTVQHKNGKTLYCVVDPATTGSRLPKQICQGREEWARQGLVISTGASADNSSASPKG